MEENFVPSYKNEDERLNARKKRDRKNRIITICVTIICIGILATLIFLGYTLVNINYSKYEKYEEKMYIYGFSDAYDNKEASTKQKVTKSEAVKMILACVYNVNEIDGIALSTDETYSNAIWVEYAIKQGIVSKEEVNASNADDKVKYQEVLVWLYNVKAKILNLEPDTESNYDIKDINAYNNDTKLAVYDLLNSGVIVTNTKRINGNQKLFKGKLNELIVNFAEQYNTITVGDAKININEEKIPENAQMYPYTLASVQKDVYEIDFINNNSDTFISPVDYYRENKQYYSQIKNYVEGYYNYILAIDYNNITNSQMKRKLKKYVLDEFNEDVLDRYIEYVKKNHIKLNGSATAELPCIYYDGENYRVRVKLDIVIDNSDTRDNLLYLDLEGDTLTYNDDNITVYIDAILGKNDVSQTLFIKEESIGSMIVKQNSMIVGGE